MGSELTSFVCSTETQPLEVKGEQNSAHMGLKAPKP